MLATIAIALGVGVVVWVTGAYESIRLSIADRVWNWIGRSHITVESVYGQNGTVYESIVDDVRPLPNVTHVAGRLKDRVDAVISDPQGNAVVAAVDAIGIIPSDEYAFRDYRDTLAGGRVLRDADHDVAMVERSFAAEHGLKLGDTLGLRRDVFGEVHTFRIVGLLERRRIERFQAPMVVIPLAQLQAIVPHDGRPRVTQVDVMLADTSPMALGRTASEIIRLVDRYRQGFRVTSAQAKLKQVETAQQQTQFILILISGVALFTAFFIILSTLSMGMVARIAQLGLLRCVGMTRWQLGVMVLAEVVPVGLLGTLLGIPVGLGLIELSVLFAPQYVGTFAVSDWGIALALVGGAVTAIGGGSLPAIQAMRVSPLEASRPQSRQVRPVIDALAGVLGIAMIGGHVVMIERLPVYAWLTSPPTALVGVMLLYCGYALLAPPLIRFGGGLFVRVASATLRLRSQLLGDQIGRASWRSAGICSGLMVGLSLIVCLVIHTESVTAAWDFPARMCEAFVWTRHPVSVATAQKAAAVPGVADYTLVNDIQCSVGRFAAGDPRSFFKMATLEFVAGTQEDAVAKLEKGGYILISPPFAERFDYKLNDPVRIVANGRAAQFRIAGIVESPAIDIAATYFNADSHLAAAQMNGVMGTLADAERCFGIGNEVTLVLLNFDLPASNPPRLFREKEIPRRTRPAYLVAWMDDWSAAMPERRAELAHVARVWRELGDRGDALTWPRLPADLHFLGLVKSVLDERMTEIWSQRSPAERWRAFREEIVMALIADRCNAHDGVGRSVAALKHEIDQTLRTATYLMTAIPMVALVVAAMGVANLMMANVTSRTRQLAVMRAVGATKSQITRLVIGEAIVLGAIGSALGLVLGMQAAYGVNYLTFRIWGFGLAYTLPFRFIATAIALTVSVCVVAGVLPARRAARSNVVAAMQTV